MEPVQDTRRSADGRTEGHGTESWQESARKSDRSVAAAPELPTGLLIIRAWIEEGSSAPLRVQIRVSSDVAAGFERTVTVTGAEAACATVTEWLAHLSADAPRGPPGPAPVG